MKVWGLLLLAACGQGRAREVAHDAAPAPAPAFAPLDGARLDELAAVAPTGFAVTARDRSATSLVVQLHAAPLRGLVTIAPCLHCRAADPAAWADLVPALRQLMPGALEDDPATQFELSAIDVGDRRCIATWELGAVSYGDELDASHAARVYCNDGATELVVRVDDDAVTTAPTVNAARAAAHRDVVERAARALAGAYLAALAR